jgi:ornithine cyclodeaminase
MSVLFLNRADVEALLPYGECIDIMAGALSALARGDAFQPLRAAHWLPDRRGLLVAMPGGLFDGGEQGARGVRDILGIKVLSVFPGNAAHGEESHQGAVLLFDAEKGRPLAFLDAASITAIRTAAVSALATRLLAREDAGDLALLGTGVQARTHLAALCEVRTLRRVRAWSRNPESARRFAAEESARHGLPVEAVATAEEAVAGADLVCTVTAAVEPVLQGEWIAPGAHVNAVGACTPNARELDTAAVVRARLFVDRRESALNEPGDLLIPLREGAIGPDHILGEIGDLLLGRVEGRRDASDVTLFESLGLTVEDLAAARHIYEKAVGQGRGISLPL